MKQLFLCEMCGAEFTEWRDCYKCENSHCDPEVVRNWSLPDDFTIPPMVYKPGEAYPEIITVKFPVRNEEGETVRDENDLTLWKCLEYKRVSHDAPTRMQKFADAIHQRDITETAAAEEWRKKREEEHRKQEQEQETDTPHTDDNEEEE